MSDQTPRVLIADDDPFYRQLLKVIVQAANWALAGEAGDGRQAVALFESVSPDMLLLDVNMPELNGDDVLNRVLEIDPSACVVVLTGHDSDTERQRYLDAGATRYAVKGTPAEMADILQEAWRSYTQTQ